MMPFLRRDMLIGGIGLFVLVLVGWDCGGWLAGRAQCKRKDSLPHVWQHCRPCGNDNC
jgi:hypothetical protein